MEEVLKTGLDFYLSVALFVLFMDVYCISYCIYRFIKKTKEMENRKVKTILCVAFSSALIIVWAYFFAYKMVYPRALAYYEYKNDVIEEKSGVVNSIRYEPKDRIYIQIDDITYSIAYPGSSKIDIAKGLKKGDSVRFIVGKHSMYVFEISKE